MPDDPGAASAGLSERQIACLRHVAAGLSSKKIGRALGISPSTVDNHIHVAVSKLHAKNRWHAAQLISPISSENTLKPGRKAGMLPPLGGRLNSLSVRQRVTQMLTIATIGLIVLTAAYAVILGAMVVFGSI